MLIDIYNIAYLWLDQFRGKATGPWHVNAFFLCGHEKHSGVMVPVCPGREGGKGGMHGHLYLVELFSYFSN